MLTISQKFSDYGHKVLDALKEAGFRADLDDSSERVQAKIRNAQELKIPYMLVVGGKDAEAGTVSVRDRSQGDLGAVPLDRFIERAKEDVESRGRAPLEV